MPHEHTAPSRWPSSGHWACVGGYYEIAPAARTSYHCFVDSAGGSGKDAFAMAISHKEGNNVIIGCVREKRPPFKPSEVIEDFAPPISPFNPARLFLHRYSRRQRAFAARRQRATSIPSADGIGKFDARPRGDEHRIPQLAHGAKCAAAYTFPSADGSDGSNSHLSADPCAYCGDSDPPPRICSWGGDTVPLHADCEEYWVREHEADDAPF